MSRRRIKQVWSLGSSSLWLLCLVLGCAFHVAGQESAPAPQPRSGAAQPQQKPASSSAEPVSAFIGYVSNKSIVFPDIATSPGPLTTTGKFKLFVNQSISPPYIFVAASGAAFDQARDVPKDLGQGWGAYGSRFGASMARSSTSSFFESFLLASLLHQDPRFFPQSKPTLWGSLKYSTQRVVITRTDAGKNVFNTSGLLGPLASEGLANVYLPPSEQTVGKTLARFAADLGWRVGGNMFKNYWPTFFRNMGLHRLKVIPDPKAPQGQGSRQ